MNQRNPLEQNMTRRDFLKRMSRSAFALLSLSFGSVLYGLYGERFRLHTERITLKYAHLPENFHGLKIVHFSDAHLGPYFSIRQLDKLNRTIEQLKPDLICFTGDLYDYQAPKDTRQPVEAWKSLKAPLGKWAVLGNHDYTLHRDHTTPLLEQSGFQVLNNRSVKLNSGAQSIYLAGVEDALIHKANLQQALTDVPEQAFKVLLAHEPDFADQCKQANISLQLSGHSHGGQVRIPFVGAIVTPKLAKNYVQGLYTITDTPSPFHLYVNRGIGTSRLPIRIFCLPEVTLITLEAE